MNRLQRIVVVCGLAALVLLGLFPPWRYYDSGSVSNTVGFPGRHALIFSQHNEFYGSLPGIDFARLGVEAALIVGITLIVILVLNIRQMVRPPT